MTPKRNSLIGLLPPEIPVHSSWPTTHPRRHPQKGHGQWGGRHECSPYREITQATESAGKNRWYDIPSSNILQVLSRDMLLAQGRNGAPRSLDHLLNLLLG